MQRTSASPLYSPTALSFRPDGAAAFRAADGLHPVRLFEIENLVHAAMAFLEPRNRPFALIEDEEDSKRIFREVIRTLHQLVSRSLGGHSPVEGSDALERALYALDLGREEGTSLRGAVDSLRFGCSLALSGGVDGLAIAVRELSRSTFARQPLFRLQRHANGTLYPEPPSALHRFAPLSVEGDESFLKWTNASVKELWSMRRSLEMAADSNASIDVRLAVFADVRSRVRDLAHAWVIDVPSEMARALATQAFSCSAKNRKERIDFRESHDRMMSLRNHFVRWGHSLRAETKAFLMSEERVQNEQELSVHTVQIAKVLEEASESLFGAVTQGLESVREREDELHRLRRDVWMFRQIAKAFLALAEGFSGHEDSFEVDEGAAFARDFIAHVRTMGLPVLMRLEYPRIERLTEALLATRDVDGLQKRTLSIAVAAVAEANAFLLAAYDGLSKKPALANRAFDRNEAVRLLKIHLGRA